MKLSQRLRSWKISERESGSRASVLLVFLLVAVFIFLPDTASAATAAQQFGILESISLFLAGLIIQFTQFLGFMIALITEIVLVPVMSYNGFSTSPVIGAGWAVVRDVMNMGFVIVLLIIAIVTIFGGQVGSWSVKWQQQIPKLLLFAILINFSRMICSFLIDIGQVIMLTFANAIKDIAGGNIIQVFGLTDFITFDRASLEQAISNNTGTDAFNLFTSAMLALIMTLIVFGTMVMLTVILVYRIVTLWVLVVLSPLAFFFGGAEVLAKSGGGNPYAEWWKKFSGAVAIGPVLVFFLWLTLSVAGQGNIASAESFPMGGSSVDVGTPLGFLTKIADPGRFLSFIIGIGMLFVGFEASQKFADALPGVASSLVKGGVKSALKIGAGGAAVAGVGANLGLLAGVAGVAGIGAGGVAAAKFAGKTQVGQEFRGKIGSWMTEKGGKLGGVTGLGWAGRYMARTGTSLEQSRRGEAVGRFHEQEEAVKNMTLDEKHAELQSEAITPEGVMRQNAMAASILFNPGARKKYEKDHGKEALAKMYQRFEENGGGDLAAGDDKVFEQRKNFRKSRVDLLSDEDKAEVLENMDDEDFKKVDPASLVDPALQAELKRRTEYDREGGADGKGGTISLWERMQKGRYGDQLKKATDGKQRDMNPAHMTPDLLRNMPAERQTAANLAALSPDQLEIVMQSPNFQIQNLSTDYVRDNADVISRSVSAEKIQELANSPNNGDTFRTGLQSAIATNDAAGRGYTPQQQEMRINLVMSTNGAINLPDSGSLGYHQASGQFGKDTGKEAFEGALARDASILARYKDGLVPKADGSMSDISISAVENVDVNELIRAMRLSGKENSPERNEWRETLGKVAERMKEYVEAAKKADRLPGSELKRYRQKIANLESERKIKPPSS